MAAGTVIHLAEIRQRPSLSGRVYRSGQFRGHIRHTASPSAAATPLTVITSRTSVADMGASVESRWEGRVAEVGTAPPMGSAWRVGAAALISRPFHTPDGAAARADEICHVR